MTLCIMTENGTAQEGLFDGYAVAERVLEGVMFRVVIQNDNIVCLGPVESAKSYVERFSKKQITEWLRAIEETLEKDRDGLLVNDDDAWIEEV